jgi:RNA-directed DNA polymerase
MWLKVPVEERDEQGNRRMSGGQKSKMGTPQGGVISPLLANIYMHRYLRYWEQQGMGGKLKAKVINYADDFVILTKGKAREALQWTAGVMAGLKLKLNQTKTCVRDARRESFKFLGYDFGPRFHRRAGCCCLEARPSTKAVERLKEKLHKMLGPGNVQPLREVTTQTNRVLRGWSAYFSYGNVYPAYRALDNHLYDRFRHFLRRRHKIQSSGTNLLATGQDLGRWGITRLLAILCERRALGSQA